MLYPCDFLSLFKYLVKIISQQLSLLFLNMFFQPFFHANGWLHVTNIALYFHWGFYVIDVTLFFYMCYGILLRIAVQGAVRGSRQGLFPPRRFLPLHQPTEDDLTWPLSPTNPFWSGESAGTSWPRLTPPSSERSWRPLSLDGAGWNVLYLISCQLRLIYDQ